MNKTNSFRDRMTDYKLERRVVTQGELKNISRRFKEQNDVYFTDTDKGINLEEVLFRCKENIESGKKYVLTPQHEGENPAGIVPLEELALMELFRTGDSYNNEAIVLLNNERVKLKWNKSNDINEIETIEISFENIQVKNDMENELEKQF